MDFYKKAAFIFILIVFSIIIIIKSLEPVIEKQLSQIFSDRKISNKVDKELINLTEDFTPSPYGGFREAFEVQVDEASEIKPIIGSERAFGLICH